MHFKGKKIFADCGGELTSMSGVLSSPNYPRDYSSYADCLWVIKVIHYLNYYAYLASIKKDNCSEKHYFVEKLINHIVMAH